MEGVTELEAVTVAVPVFVSVPVPVPVLVTAAVPDPVLDVEAVLLEVMVALAV